MVTELGVADRDNAVFQINVFSSQVKYFTDPQSSHGQQSEQTVIRPPEILRSKPRECLCARYVFARDIIVSVGFTEFFMTFSPAREAPRHQGFDDRSLYRSLSYRCFDGEVCPQLPSTRTPIEVAVWRRCAEEDDFQFGWSNQREHTRHAPPDGLDPSLAAYRQAHNAVQIQIGMPLLPFWLTGRNRLSHNRSPPAAA